MSKGKQSDFVIFSQHSQYFFNTLPLLILLDIIIIFWPDYRSVSQTHLSDNAKKIIEP